MIEWWVYKHKNTSAHIVINAYNKRHSWEILKNRVADWREWKFHSWFQTRSTETMQRWRLE